MKSKISIFISLLIITLFIALSCTDNKAIPKPKGYFRIDLPQKTYKAYISECPFTFDIPSYSYILKEKEEYCWENIYFPQNQATIYLTYKSINNDLDTLIEDSREFVYKHTIKADAIDETRYENDSLKVYGVLYDIKGNAASSVQFFLTDSISHFMRGSLYFSVPTNKDSLAPVIDFIREDILVMIESFEWK
jgi:gliding motility-associated lipoprotein GldD